MSRQPGKSFGSSLSPRGLSRALGLCMGVLGLLVGVLVAALPGPAGAAATVTVGPLSWAAPQSIDGTNSLHGTCGSSSLCVAVDNVGNVVTSTNPTGGAWSAPVNVDGTNHLVDVSCVSTSLCVAIDSSGNVVTSTNPAGGAGAWSAPGHVDTNGFADISCASTSLCAAVDTAGNVVTSTNPTGGAGAWSAPVNIDSHPLTGISCPSTSLCVAVDSVAAGQVPVGQVVTSTDPTGGAGAWSAPVQVDTNGIADISCASTSLCVAADLGAGTGRTTNLVTSTNPTGGAGAWSVAGLENGLQISPEASSPYAFYGVSCPSTSLCVAADDFPNVWTSMNPAGGANAGWTAAPGVDPPSGLTGGVSCPSTSLCVGFDSAGNVVVATPAPPVVPVVTGTTPANGATGVDSTSLSVSAVFSEAMNVSSTAGAFSLQDDTTGQAVPGKVLWTSSSTTTADFLPTAGFLTGGDQYTATVSTAATAQNGAALASPVSWSFTVAAPAPVVTSTTPASGATGVPVTTALTATFSEPINEGTTSGAFSLQDDTTGQAVPVSGFPVGTNEVSFLPSVSLTSGDQYTATISTAATDTAGVPLASPYSWTFTTTPNSVQVLIPSNNATMSGTTTLDGSATSPSAVTSFQYELNNLNCALNTTGYCTPIDGVVATAKPTFFGWLAQESNGTWGWDSTSVPNGPYLLTAVVTYKDGTQVTGGPLAVTVSNPVPTAQVLIPSAGATLSGTTFLDATASYTPNITQFTYDLDGAAVGNAVASPWGWLLLNWNTTTVANGSHTLTSVATYSDGAMATSPAVTVTITNP